MQSNFFQLANTGNITVTFIHTLKCNRLSSEPRSTVLKQNPAPSPGVFPPPFYIWKSPKSGFRTKNIQANFHISCEETVYHFTSILSKLWALLAQCSQLSDVA
ncbi:hypothetical protein KIL84_019844 [Mauremys mutica]|uniref:Uncharacterized protein n=1 Tax=Mauremys mutica TaxID=74926 RepID=A0A9D4BB04_9SAUR|nr:hypothetical protein KIL84_019844 [Mauremys mutica]